MRSRKLLLNIESDGRETALWAKACSREGGKASAVDTFKLLISRHGRHGKELD